MTERRVAALILAAGESRRMGAANKLLAPYRGKPVLLHVVDALGAVEFAQRILVTGHESAAVRACVGEGRVEFVEAEDYAVGMSASIRAGICALAASVDAVLICLGDMPDVRSEDVTAIADRFLSSSGEPIVVPMHAGRRGNPILWPRRHFAALAELEADRGARDLLDTFESEVVRVCVDHPGVLRDIDTPADLEA